jgi:hypothetical protein
MQQDRDHFVDLAIDAALKPMVRLLLPYISYLVSFTWLNGIGW